MSGLPGGCKTPQEFERYVHDRVFQCMRIFRSKEETVRHLRDQCQVIPGLTTIAWDNIAREHPDFFRSYENQRRIRERDATNAMANPAQFTGETGFQQDSGMTKGTGSKWFARQTPGQQEQIRRAVEADAAQAAANAKALNPQIFVGQNSSKAGSSKAQEKQQLQAPQEPLSPSAEFWEQLLTTLGQIKSNTDQLKSIKSNTDQIKSNTDQMKSNTDQMKSNTDQMHKLMTDGQGFGPRASAAGSSKRQRVEKEQERGDKEEAEKLQEQVRGDDEEAEKLQEQVRGDDEEAEKVQDLNQSPPP